MSIETDLTLWEQAAKWAWAMLVVPLGWIWRRAADSVSKDDFKEVKDSVKQLYEEAKEDRKLVRDGFDKLGGQIHDSHIALINRMDDIR